VHATTSGLTGDACRVILHILDPRFLNQMETRDVEAAAVEEEAEEEVTGEAAAEDEEAARGTQATA